MADSNEMHDNPKPRVKSVHPDDIHHTDGLAFVPISAANIIVNGSNPSSTFLSPTQQPRRPARPQTAPSQDQVALLPSAFRAHTISLPSSPYRESPSRSASGPNPDLREALQSLTAGDEKSGNGKGSRKGGAQTVAVSRISYSCAI